MEFHEAANLFPLMEGKDFDALKADIAEHGQRDPVWTWSGKILDGRNRWRACEELGKECQTREWDGKGSPEAFVVSLNLHRRHLSESQRAMVASKIANIEKGAHKDRPKFAGQICPADSPGVSVSEAAEMLNVGSKSVKKAKSIRAHGAAELVAAVEGGDVSVHAAYQVAHQPVAEQRDFVKARREGMHHAGKNGNGIVAKTKTHKGRKAPAAIRGAIGTLVGLATGLDSFTVKDAAPTSDEVEQWEKDLALVISAINRFRRQLKEVNHV